MLRQCNFDPTSLKRRSTGVPGSSKKEFSEETENAVVNVSQDQRGDIINEVACKHKPTEMKQQQTTGDCGEPLRGLSYANMQLCHAR